MTPNRCAASKSNVLSLALHTFCILLVACYCNGAILIEDDFSDGTFNKWTTFYGEDPSSNRGASKSECLSLTLSETGGGSQFRFRVRMTSSPL